jgi:ABC-type phosphate transport system substrate-binding protein
MSIYVISPHLIVLAVTLHGAVIIWNNTAEAQFSVKLVGSGGAATADLYNSYGAYYGYSKDNVALAYTAAASIDQALLRYQQNLVDFVGVDTALDADQFNGVQGLVQLPIVGLPLVIGYNLPTLLPTDSLVRLHTSSFPHVRLTNFLRFLSNEPQPPLDPLVKLFFFS